MLLWSVCQPDAPLVPFYAASTVIARLVAGEAEAGHALRQQSAGGSPSKPAGLGPRDLPAPFGASGREKASQASPLFARFEVCL